MSKTQEIAKRLVAYFNNSQTKTAAALKVSQPTVNGWIKGKHNISAKVALRAELITNKTFLAADLCADLSEAGVEAA